MDRNVPGPVQRVWHFPVQHTTKLIEHSFGETATSASRNTAQIARLKLSAGLLGRT